MALCGALCVMVNTVTGFTNKGLRGLVAGLLGTDNNANQMSYDLRRLGLHGLIEKIGNTNTYHPTTEGIRVAVFYTKTRDRLLDRSSTQATNHQPPSSFDVPSNKSNAASTTTPPNPDSAQQHKNSSSLRGLRPQEI